MTQVKTKKFNSVESIITSLAESLRPPERLSVAESSEKYVYLNNPGSYVGFYKNSMAWYMIEPMNELASRDKKAVIFVGPAQAAKTQALLLNWLAYSVVVDPMDIALFSPTQGMARDFSMRRVDRLHRHSKDVGARLASHRDADNKFDKHYTTGTMLTLTYPSVTELAGRPLPRVALTDYDRMPDDIGGDGSPFDLARKRTTTFGSYAMTLAESSPSRAVTDTSYIPSSPHEAPPTTGILALYNRGDRRKRYWPCPHCGEYFEGRFSLLEWDETLPTKIAKAASVRLVCPHCDERIHPNEKNKMDEKGKWIKDGQSISKCGEVTGVEPENDIGSFWLNGVAAAFVSWSELVSKFIDANEDYERTQNQESLKTFYNTDLGEVYYPKGVDSERMPEVLMSRAEPFPFDLIDSDEAGIERRVGRGYDPLIPKVPDGVRFLIATIDVQKNMFVVQVHGISPGLPYDISIIDRFNIVKSDRFDGSGDRMIVKPGSYAEDWDLITRHVLSRTYELGDGSGRRMMIKQACCDSGGREGVTTMAYDYYRRLVSEGEATRFILIKGDHVASAPRSRISYPDASKKDRFAAARGDVPVMLFNSNVLKDALASRLESITPGKGMIRFANWLPDFVFSELCVEVRKEKGWENPLNKRNETWDLCYYAIGISVSHLIGAERIEWDAPPSWAALWDNNLMVIEAEEPLRFSGDDDFDFSSLGRSLA